jgi:hypothetical protein
MKALTAIGSALLLFGIGAAAHAPAADAADKAMPLLCAPTIVLECRPDGTCPSTTPAAADVPAFVKVDSERKEITTLDGRRTSPIKRVDHLSDRLVLQGGEEENAWTVVVSEATGDMSATASGADHTFVIFGACTAFPGSAP